MGYACDDEGFCAGGTLTDVDLDLDVPAYVVVTGDITANGGGALPFWPGSTTGGVHLTFTSLDGLPSVSDYFCNELDFTYEAKLFAGTYRIAASGGGGVAVPSTSVVVIERIRFE